MRSSKEIKCIAKQNFYIQYGICVGALILIGVIIGAIELYGKILYEVSSSYSIIHRFLSKPGFLATLLLLLLNITLNVLFIGPLKIAQVSFAMRIYRGQQGDIRSMFGMGFWLYGRNIGGYVWMQLFIWLWSLLLIIPGIIKSIAYSMTPYLLADCPYMKATDAIKLSMRITAGYKADIFIFYLSFIGWHILNIITLGLVWVFYSGPYFHISFAGMYEELKANAIRNDIITPEELA